MRRLLKWLGISLGAISGLLGIFILLVITGAIGPAKVPPEAIAHRVIRTPTKIQASFELPAASRYKKGLHFQTNGSMCGPASLVNVFRSLGDRVADEGDVLEGTGKCAIGICWMGLTLDELAEVARHSDKRRVTLLRDLEPEQFRQHLRASNEPDVRYIINFARKPIFGGGSGHHSPIGGYLEAEALVLVLDVNEDYKPWLIQRDRLYTAMNTLDGNKKRGLLRIE